MSKISKVKNNNSGGKETRQNPDNDYFEKFGKRWKKSFLIASVVVITIIIVGIANLAQAIGVLTNLFNNAKSYFYKAETILDKGNKSKSDSTETFGFLVFHDKNCFDLWHQEVTFRLGLPKYARNLATDEIDEDSTVKQYANWRKHPSPNDKRIFCGFNERVPSDLINDGSAKKYKFIKATYSDLEEMGFIKDSPNLIEQNFFDYSISSCPEFVNYIQPIPNREWTSVPELNINFVVIIFKVNEFRNKYLFDYGFSDNECRISVYLDKKDLLCFRVIDKNHKGYILRLAHDLFGRIYQYNFKFATNYYGTYMEVYINGNLVAAQNFAHKIPFTLYFKNRIFNGANREGTYCAKMRIYYSNVKLVQKNRTHDMGTFDSHKLEGIYLSDGEIITYKSNDGDWNFYHR